MRADSPGPPFQNASRDGRRESAFTFVELLLVLALLVIVAALAVPQYAEALEAARVGHAISEIKTLEREILVYEHVNGKLPVSLAEIGRATLLDPWQQPYRYFPFPHAGAGLLGSVRKDKNLVPLNTSFDLYSVGADGKTKPPLNAKDSLDDVVRAHDGSFIGLAERF